MTKRQQINPIKVVLKHKLKDVYRVIHCYRVDPPDTSKDFYPVHFKVVNKAGTRFMTEWFEKARWDFVVKSKRPYKKREHYKPREEVKSEPPRILLAEEPEKPVVPPTAPARKSVSLNEEQPGEYNPRAHTTEPFWGKADDLAMFDAKVTSEYTMQEGVRKVKLARARKELIERTQQGPLGVGAAFTPDGTR